MRATSTTASIPVPCTTARPAGWIAPEPTLSARRNTKIRKGPTDMTGDLLAMATGANKQLQPGCATHKGETVRKAACPTPRRTTGHCQRTSCAARTKQSVVHV